MAIMRLWHGEVAIEKADEYEQFMIERAAPDYGSVDGLIKLYFQRRSKEPRSLLRGSLLLEQPLIGWEDTRRSLSFPLFYLCLQGFSRYSFASPPWR